MRLIYETIQFSPYLCDAEIGLARQFEAAANAGFDGVGIDVWSIERHLERGGSEDDLVASLERAGIPCLELQAMAWGHGSSIMEPPRFIELVELLRPEIVMAGCAPDIAPQAAAEFRQAADAIAALGGRVAIEFLPMLPLDSIAKTREVLRRIGGNVGVCVDTWHFFRGPDGWAELDALPATELSYVQFNDAPPVASEDVWHETLQRRALPGEGEFDLPRFCDSIARKGYEGPVAVEIMSDSLRALGPEQFAIRVITAARKYWP